MDLVPKWITRRKGGQGELEAEFRLIKHCVSNQLPGFYARPAQRKGREPRRISGTNEGDGGDQSLLAEGEVGGAL